MIMETARPIELGIAHLATGLALIGVKVDVTQKGLFTQDLCISSGIVPSVREYLGAYFMSWRRCGLCRVAEATF